MKKLLITIIGVALLSTLQSSAEQILTRLNVSKTTGLTGTIRTNFTHIQRVRGTDFMINAASNRLILDVYLDVASASSGNLTYILREANSDGVSVDRDPTAEGTQSYLLYGYGRALVNPSGKGFTAIVSFSQGDGAAFGPHPLVNHYGTISLTGTIRNGGVTSLTGNGIGLAEIAPGGNTQAHVKFHLKAK